MKVMKPKSRMRYLMGNNPMGELMRIVAHQFTTAKRKKVVKEENA